MTSFICFSAHAIRAWHLVVVRISLSITRIYGNHVCNMFHQWGILMATTQMFHCLHFHPSMTCSHSYSHNGQWQDVDNNKVPCPTCLFFILAPWTFYCCYTGFLNDCILCWLVTKIVHFVELPMYLDIGAIIWPNI